MKIYQLAYQSTQTDNTGAVVDSYSFDAWGNRVGDIWNTPDAITHLFDRGFTGHEHLDQFGLINMNGRIYDPKLGRFLSPDPYIQAPDNTQSHNRYSYCFNNPLILTDANGYWSGWDDVIVGGVGFACGYLTYGIANKDWGWNAVGAGFVGAGTFLLGYYTGGTSTIANGFATAGFQGCANTVALSYAGTTALCAAASSFMPSFTLLDDGTTSISISPSISTGIEGIGLGANLNIKSHDPKTGITIGANIGLTNYFKYGPSGSSMTEIRSGVYAGVIGRDGGAIYSINNFYGGGFDQTTGSMTGLFKIGKEMASATYENDWIFGLLGADGGDRYRTAAVKLQWGDYSIGTNLFTGNPNLEGTLDMESRAYEKIDGHNTYVSREGGTPDNYRFGSLYVGYKDFRVSANSEKIRHLFQNRFAHDILMKGGPKWFKILNIPSQMGVSIKTSNGYTTW